MEKWLGAKGVKPLIQTHQCPRVGEGARYIDITVDIKGWDQRLRSKAVVSRMYVRQGKILPSSIRVLRGNTPDNNRISQ